MSWRAWSTTVALLAIVSCTSASDVVDAPGGRPAPAPAPTTTPVTTPAHGTEPSAATSPADPPAVPDGRGSTIRFVSQNVLHGRSCPPDTDRCRLGERLALLTEQLVDAGCPEVVMVQEFNREVASLIEPHLGRCGYGLVWDDDPGLDREAVLTTETVVDSSRIRLPGGFRTAQIVLLESDVGPVVAVNTHLASSADNGDCAGQCPPPCADGDELRRCQAHTLADVLERLDLDRDVLLVLGGDLNATPDDPTYDLLRGSFDDVLADELECGPERAKDCTAGRASTSMVDLTDPTSAQRHRVDHLLMRPHARCVPSAAGSFNAEPDDGPIAFPSDHTGVMVELTCSEPSQEPHVPPLPADEPPVSAGAEVDDTVATAVRIAFEGLFDGAEPDVDQRLRFLEGGDERRDEFVRLLDAAGAAATATSVEVESVAGAADGSVAVVFDLLVDGAVVFDDRTGTAVLDDGRWVVGAATFCDLATILAPDVGC